MKASASGFLARCRAMFRWYSAKSKMQRWMIALVTASVLIFAVKKVFVREPAVAREVVAEHVPEFSLTVETSGRLQPASEIYVSVKRGGRLDQVLVNPGSPVKKGQLIAVVDETMNRSAIEGALANYRLAGSELGRLQSLFRSSAATAQELDQARAMLSTRRSELEQARQKLEDGLIRSPMDGNLALLPFKLGESVPDGARVAVIEDRSGYRLRAALPIQWLGRIPESSEVTFARYGSGDLSTEVRMQLPKIHCQIVTPSAEKTAAASEFEIEIKFPQIPSGFGANDLATVSIAIGVFQDLWRIPASALTFQNDKSSVLTQTRDGRLEFINVDVISGDNQFALVKTNLSDIRLLEAIDQKRVQEAILKRKHPRIVKADKGIERKT